MVFNLSNPPLEMLIFDLCFLKTILKVTNLGFEGFNKID